MLDGGDLLMQLEKDFLKTQSHDNDDNEDHFYKIFLKSIANTFLKTLSPDDDDQMHLSCLDIDLSQIFCCAGQHCFADFLCSIGVYI